MSRYSERLQEEEGLLRYPLQKYRDMLDMDLPPRPRPCRWPVGTFPNTGETRYCGQQADHDRELPAYGITIAVCNDHKEDS